jgi:hypothetical protein
MGQMDALVRSAGPLLPAAVSTAFGMLAFLLLSAIGFTPETRLIAALILAGTANICAFASLNGATFLPTCSGAVGDL